MADEIEGGEVHSCRVGVGELLTVRKTWNGRDVPQPIRTVTRHLKTMDEAGTLGQGAFGAAGPALVGSRLPEPRPRVLPARRSGPFVADLPPRGVSCGAGLGRAGHGRPRARLRPAG
jgi:hypothetical protein